jgi:CubicO group peptidase (beta-lactamase class C family)
METKRPFTVEAPCRIASVTKPHTTTLMAMLVSDGKLSWDDSVDKFLPQFAKLSVKGKGPASRPPKIRELLSHTAGFPGDDQRRGGEAGFKTDGTLAEAVDDLARAGLATEPGSVFAYTGLGYLVAGRVAEVVTGQEFGALMSERLLKPVGATTAVFHSAAPAELTSRMPTMYERTGGQLVKADLSTRGEARVHFPTPGGGLISTLDDVGRVLMLHRNRGVVDGKQLVAPESLRALYQRQPATGRPGYGLGCNTLRTDAIGHIGASGTFIVIDFKEDLLVVMLTQVRTKQNQAFHDRVRKAIGSVFPARESQ